MEFTPEQKVLNDLFGNDLTYIIPEYQRPYSWDCIGKSDKNNQVNTMWDDLIGFFESQSKDIYFMGSMVVIGDGTQRRYEVIDGQQRLTTLTILLTAIKCFLTEIIKDNQNAPFREYAKRASDNIDNLLFNQQSGPGLYVESVKKVKIEKAIDFDYDQVLKVIMECGDITAISMSDVTEDQKIVTNRYFKNRSFFIEKLKSKFLDSNGKLTDEKARALDGFFNFLKNKVTVIQIRSPRFEVAYQIFEILNNRGLPLSNKDLLRNFVIRKFQLLKEEDPDKYKDLIPNEKWRNLENEYQFDADFISRYVESTTGRSQQYSAFNDIQQLFSERYKVELTSAPIENFYKELEFNLSIYSQIRNLQFDNLEIKHRVSFLNLAGNNKTIINLLMALLRYTNDNIKINKFLKTIEKHIIFIYLGNYRFTKSPFFLSIQELNNNNYEKAMEKMTQDIFDDAELFEVLNAPIYDNDIAKLIIYKYFTILDREIDDVVEQELIYAKSTLEHIMPQSPDDNTNWTNDFTKKFRDSFTYQLGNMTLLTSKMNSKAKNYDFLKKKEIYANTKLIITRDLTRIDRLDENFLKNRHQHIVNTILKDLDLL